LLHNDRVITEFTVEILIKVIGTAGIQKCTDAGCILWLKPLTHWRLIRQLVVCECGGTYSRSMWWWFHQAWSRSLQVPALVNRRRNKKS